LWLVSAYLHDTLYLIFKKMKKWSIFDDKKRSKKWLKWKMYKMSFKRWFLWKMIFIIKTNRILAENELKYVLKHVYKCQMNDDFYRKYVYKCHLNGDFYGNSIKCTKIEPKWVILTEISVKVVWGANLTHYEL